MIETTPTSDDVESDDVESDDIEHVRAFNRRWTEVVRLLDRGLTDDTNLSPTEARVVCELHQRERSQQRQVRNRLDIDASFLTRVVRRLADRGLLDTIPSVGDGRAVDLTLTPAGRTVAVELTLRARDQIDVVLGELSDDQRASAIEAMSVLRHLIAPPRHEHTDDRHSDIVIRPHRPGDLGWIAGRNGAVYADEFGWGNGYEALCAEIVAEFDRTFDPTCERAFVVEVDGARAGCALLIRRRGDATPDGQAQIRLVLVERWARGLGLGRRLVDECLDFARAAGYASIMLWTNDVLVAARRIYERAGFELVEETPHHSFGHDLVGQVWSRRL